MLLNDWLNEWLTELLNDRLTDICISWAAFAAEKMYTGIGYENTVSFVPSGTCENEIPHKTISSGQREYQSKWK